MIIITLSEGAMKRVPAMVFLPVMLVTLFFILSSGCLTSPKDTEKKKSDVEVDTNSLNFGETQNTLYFNVTLNNGATAWEIRDGDYPDWCSIAIEQTSTGARISVTVNRQNLSPGEHTASIPVKWNSGSQLVKIIVIIPNENDESGTIIIDTPLPEQGVIKV